MIMKKKKIYVLSGMLFIAAILFFISLPETSVPDLQNQDVVLRAGIQDVSIDDMIKTSENRKFTENNPNVNSLEIGRGGSNDQLSNRSDSPEAISRIQQLIRENNESLKAGLNEMENERQGIITYADERDVYSTAQPAPTGSSSPVIKRDPVVAVQSTSGQEENTNETTPEDVGVVHSKPKKHSPFNSVSFGSRDNKNAIKAYVHSEQTVSDGSTLKMRLGEDAYTDNGILIPKNSPIFGTVTSVDGERVNVKITHINHQGNILPFEKLVYSKDALLGIYVPGNPKSDATKDAAGGALDGLPTSGIPGLDAATQIAGVVASSAAQAGKQAISKNVKKIKVTIKTNYEIYLRPDEKKNKNDVYERLFN